MRSPDAMYDPRLNEPDIDQEDVAKAVFDFTQAIRRAAADGKLTSTEVFAVAVQYVPEAARTIITAARGGDPIQSDVEMVAHIVTRQVGLYDAPQG